MSLDMYMSRHVRAQLLSLMTLATAYIYSSVRDSFVHITNIRKTDNMRNIQRHAKAFVLFIVVPPHECFRVVYLKQK